MEYLQEIVTLFLSLAGFGAFIALLVNIGKRFDWIKDGTADQVVKWINFIGLFVVGILYFVAPSTIPLIDQILAALANLGGLVFPILALVLGWPLANASAKWTHDNVKGFRVLGFSRSLQSKG